MCERAKGLVVEGVTLTTHLTEHGVEIDATDENNAPLCPTLVYVGINRYALKVFLKSNGAKIVRHSRSVAASG